MNASSSSEIPALEVRAVTLRHEGRSVLHDVSLSVAEGECVAIVGPSGSGKSTLLDLVSGALAPDEGEVVWRGRPVAGSALRLGVVHQGGGLLDWLTALDNCVFALTGGDQAAATAETRDCAVGMLESLGLTRDRLDLYPAQLSGGMQLRVAVARALVREPELLLMDEPTAGLDAPTAASLIQVLRECSRGRELTTLVATHDCRLAAGVADRIVVVSPADAQVVEGVSREDVVRIRTEPGGLEALARQVEALLAQEVARTHTAAPRAEPPRSRLRPAASRRQSATLGPVSEWLRPPAPGELRRRLGEFLPGCAALGCLTTSVVALVLALHSLRALAVVGIEEEAPGAVAGTLIRQVAPLLVGVIMAGRLGAAISTELGSMALGRQLAALRVYCTSAARYLAAPIVWGATLALPLVVWAAEVAGLLASLAWFVLVAHQSRYAFWFQLTESVDPLAVVSSGIKGAAFGFVIALVACTRGGSPKRSSRELGRHTTSAIVWSTLAVVVADFVLNRLFYG